MLYSHYQVSAIMLLWMIDIKCFLFRSKMYHGFLNEITIGIVRILLYQKIL